MVLFLTLTFNPFQYVRKLYVPKEDGVVTGIHD